MAQLVELDRRGVGILLSVQAVDVAEGGEGSSVAAVTSASFASDSALPSSSPSLPSSLTHLEGDSNPNPPQRRNNSKYYIALLRKPKSQ